MRELHEWFHSNKRVLPWRIDRTPYKVWISEIMLQQTRAAVVIAYFEKWMKDFPDIASVANAPLERVIKAWEGLGYYSRARNIHAAAKEIVEKHRGALPESPQELRALPGFGPYTVGAVRSFGFQEKAVAIDANVARVVARFYGIEENIQKDAVKRKMAAYVEKMLDDQEPWVTSEALIELGALVCTNTPRCDGCPLQKNCHAYRDQKALYLPIKNGAKPIVLLHRTCFVIEANRYVLLKKNQDSKVMQDLYEFPYFEGKRAKMPTDFALKIREIKELSQVSHTFTNFKATLYPLHIIVEHRVPIATYEWVDVDRLQELPFSSGHRRILQQCEFSI